MNKTFKTLFRLLNRKKQGTDGRPAEFSEETKRDIAVVMAELKKAYLRISELMHENAELKKEIKRISGSH